MREIGERYLKKIYYNLKTCALWLFMAGLTGVGVGAFSSAFSFCLKKVTMLRGEYPFLLYFLPAGGIVIVLLYHLCGVRQDKGTNIIMTAVHGKDQDVPAYMAPLIFAATIITHLFGGSAGREGAALQMGASIGNTIGRLFKFEEGDQCWDYALCSISSMCFFLNRGQSFCSKYGNQPGSIHDSWHTRTYFFKQR